MEQLCRSTRLEISPGGKYIAAFLGDRSETAFTSANTEVNIARVDCLAQGQGLEQCSTTLSGLDGIRLLRWERDDAAAYAVENRTRLVRYAMLPEVHRTGDVEIDADMAATLSVQGATPSQDEAAEAQALRRAYDEATAGMASMLVHASGSARASCAAVAR